MSGILISGKTYDIMAPRKEVIIPKEQRLKPPVVRIPGASFFRGFFIENLEIGNRVYVIIRVRMV